MRVDRCFHADEFLAETLGYRAATRCARTCSARSRRPRRAARWRARRARSGGSCATTPAASSAPRCAPRPTRSPSDRCTRRAPAALAVAVATADDELPAVAGFASALEAFLAVPLVSPGSRRGPATSQLQVLYAATAVRRPARPRRARGRDGRRARARPALVRRLHRGGRRASGARGASDDRAMLLATVVASGRLRWWRRDGGVPSRWRATPCPSETPGGDGHAGRAGLHAAGRAAVAATAPRSPGSALPSSSRRGSRVMLFADAANPTSNHVYRRPRLRASWTSSCAPRSPAPSDLAVGEPHATIARWTTPRTANLTSTGRRSRRFHGTGDDDYYDLDRLRAGGTLMGDEELAALDRATGGHGGSRGWTCCTCSATSAATRCRWRAMGATRDRRSTSRGPRLDRLEVLAAECGGQRGTVEADATALPDELAGSVRPRLRLDRRALLDRRPRRVDGGRSRARCAPGGHARARRAPPARHDGRVARPARRRLPLRASTARTSTRGPGPTRTATPTSRGRRSSTPTASARS